MNRPRPARLRIIEFAMTVVDRNSVGSGSGPFRSLRNRWWAAPSRWPAGLAAWDKGDLKNGEERSQGERRNKSMNRESFRVIRSSINSSPRYPQPYPYLWK
jgi:hypothetical protein